jgi:hypothetical protein
MSSLLRDERLTTTRRSANCSQFCRPLAALHPPSLRATPLFCHGSDHGILCCYFGLPFVGTMTPRDANPTEFARNRRSAFARHSPVILGGFAR